MRTKKYILTLVTFGLLASQVFAHSEGITPKVTEVLVTKYIGVQQALVKDDLKLAKLAADEYRRALNLYSSLNMKPPIIAIKRAVGKIRKAEHLDQARDAFQSLSIEILDVVEDVGLRRKSPLYSVNCPTAFNQKGGSWLQQGETIENPYHGAKNLHCGILEQQVAGRSSSSGR